MKKRIIITAVMISMVIYLLSSCYKNKEDILALPVVSFTKDIVPIMIAGGCGCHNNGQGQRAVQFSYKDTIFYDAILIRDSILNAMATFGTHPGGGEIYFQPNQEKIVAKWYAEGSPDDRGGCTVTGSITYNKNIQPIYLSSCKGGTCHGGIAAPLDYNKMVSEQAELTNMMNTGGQSHAGGALSLSTCTINTFNEWIAQGMKQ